MQLRGDHFVWDGRDWRIYMGCGNVGPVEDVASREGRGGGIKHITFLGFPKIWSILKGGH